MIKTFSNQSCFKEIISYCILQTTFQITLKTKVYSNFNAFRDDFWIGIEGMPNVSGNFLKFYPKDLLDKIIANKWPKEFLFEEVRLGNYFHASNEKTLNIGTVPSIFIQSTFVRYFEHILPDIKNRYGDDCSKWPQVCNFARIIRNAFVHDGAINFENNNAQPVSWKTLHYEPKDNGRQILYKDIADGDIIYLLLDINKELN